VVCALGLAAGGCGSTDAGGGDSSTRQSNTSDINAGAQKAIEAAYKGTFAEPPSTSPEPGAGKNIWFIPFSAQLQDWKEPGQITDAAKALGWKLTIFDGKFSPDTVVTGLRQAIADKADGIVLMVVDCAPIRAALQEVDRAGIPVVAAESLDCDETKAGEPKLFDASAAYFNPSEPDVPVTYGDFIKNTWGYSQGLGIIAGTSGKAKLIDVRETDLKATVLGDDGIRKALRDHCPDCEIVETVEIVGSDLGPTLQQKVAQAFVQHPDANSVVSPYDMATVNIAAAVQGTGRKDEIWSQGAEGIPQMINMLTNDAGVNAGVGVSVQWESWAAMDALNRLLGGERPTPTGFPSGNGAQLFTADENMPAGKRWEPPVDFHAAYRKAWGAE
jgi:ribose transport system substrate-binding protein